MADNASSIDFRFPLTPWEERVLREARDWCANREGRPTLPDAEPLQAKTDHILEMVVFVWRGFAATAKVGCGCPECGSPVECVSVGYHVDREELEAARSEDY